MKNKGNVFINAEDLYQGKTAKIVYNGSLSKSSNADLYLHLGFGMMWENLTEIKMTKTNEGYIAEVPLAKAESINFCFRDANNNWDNNETHNYSMPIAKEEVTIAKVETVAIDVPKLKKSYIIAKKIRIGFYKVITFLPKLFSGDLKRKVKE